MSDRAIAGVRRALGSVRWRLLDALAPRRVVHARGLTFTLSCDNWITQFRLDTVETKEPETLDWFDLWIRDDDLLFDVGANIGLYSLYAVCRHPGLAVVGFEPEYANLHVLRDNIVMNDVCGRIQVYPIALSDRTGVSSLHVQDLTPGAALHTESAEPLTTTESGRKVLWAEGTWRMRLDEFCAETGAWPTALKIDVDGGEGRVLTGAREVLSRGDLRTVLVECGDAGVRTTVHALLEQAGLAPVEMRTRGDADNEVWARPVSDVTPGAAA
ncbi:MAG: FkbM family methyltransferase [Vicinamibacterales bacterium]|nr:FkbM family methyltransferase [Vicinamibacterales bacterium]MDP7693527.1 FkbM family methyltransferase [Vicinamibacterales bacterium]HJN46890.1 FkbM family methyltransferase [Vicinamibacterales bacterium]